MIVLKKVTKTYQQGAGALTVLRDIDLHIAQGESVAVLGKSGAGKSTLLHILGGIDTFDGGEYFACGNDIKKLKERELARFRNEMVGFVMQDFALVPNQTALFNVMLPMYFDTTHRKEMKTAAFSALKMVGLDDKGTSLVHSLSGGEKQRVAIARAIVKSPKIILADEPTGALDTSTGRKIMEMLTALNGAGTTVVIVTHDKDVAAFCSRIIYLSDGEIQSDSKTTV